ncbi:hypothetical protein K438DRAFT_1988775 [Mycena galopus ATCC 62051]|nr:hypothetical protein K438DRAFT_1988775 [Mycena galopus ATCC 62051]
MLNFPPSILDYARVGLLGWAFSLSCVFDSPLRRLDPVYTTYGYDFKEESSLSSITAIASHLILTFLIGIPLSVWPIHAVLAHLTTI